jgi:transketolase
VDRSRYAKASGLAKGGYVLADPPDGKPDVILIGCGSEIGLCMQSCERLTTEHIKTRVVSMPSWTVFDEQDQSYRDSVLPPSITARVTVEEASPIGWDRYAGPHEIVLGMRTFGMSAPMKIVAEHFGFTWEHVVSAAKETLARSR